MAEIYNELSDNLIKKIVKAVDDGEVVCIPTETVYALIADASNDKAVEKIYAIKQRTQQKPLSVLVSDVCKAKRVVCFNESAIKLAVKFFPGPLTIVLKINNHHNLSEKINPVFGTVGVRIPNHLSCLKILKAIGRPVIGTSANISGNNHDSADPQKIIDSLSDNISIMLDEGMSNIGHQSTVVDLSNEEPKIIRPGAIADNKIFAALGYCIV
jgi:L-threonylcarbamoyladenylate synthase